MEDDNPFTKAQTIDPEVRAYVYSLVNALGGTSGDLDGRYVLGDDALAVLRDLKRWLKLYDEKTNRLDVARCLAEAKIVTGDLLPILGLWTEDGKNEKLRARMALACLELLVPLTWPLEHGEMTVNHHRHTPYLQQSQVLYKAGILTWDNTAVLRQAIRVALPSIALRREERSTRDDGIIKLVLYFFRNVTVIRQIPNLLSQGLESEVSRSHTIDCFREQDVFALILTMCSNMGEDFDQQDVVLLEILFNLIKGVVVRKLWMTEAQRKGAEVSELKATLTQERSLHKETRKSEPSRHGRFGTMIWLKREDKMFGVSGQDNIRDHQNTLLNIDKSKKWSKPQQKAKDIDHTIHDFDRTTHLTASASEKLRNFVEEFLDSGFNPLTTHLRKAIEREADRVLDVHYRQFFYVVSWFLEAERLRRDKQKREVKPTNLTTDFGAESFGLVAAVLNQETFITINRYMQNSLDNKEWQDLNASMRCFTQILLTVQEMAQSPLEEDQEIADNIQNRIFYEEATHDRIASIVRNYKDQGLGYLDACTELSHVFLRMLERYSKENADLQVRSRRRARKQKKEARKQREPGVEDAHEDDDHSENEELVDIAQVSRERKFDFKRFAAKFTSQSSVNTFVTFTTYFRELSVEQLKRAHRFFYRVAFKQELAILLYRVDIIALFYKMIQGPEGLSRKHPMFAEYSEFCKQVFRKLFKKLEERPELLVEMLFSKISKTMYFLEHGHDKVTSTSTRVPANLEINPSAGLSQQEQIGVVVSVLMKDDKSSLVMWVKSVLAKAFDERYGWEAEAQARQQDAPDDNPAQTKNGSMPTYIVVRASDASTQTATIKNARLRLLMRLVDIQMLDPEAEVDAVWIIPGNVTPTQLLESKTTIEKYETEPWRSSSAEQDPEDLLRRARPPNPIRALNEDEEARRDAFIDDSEGDDEPNLDEEFLFPDNIRSKVGNKRDLLAELKAKRRESRKRKRASDESEDDAEDEELAAKRRKLREAAALDRRRKIKSELYIRDSDEESDAERDRAFFAKEAETRRKQDQRVRNLMATAKADLADQKPSPTNKSTKKKSKRTKHSSSNEDQDQTTTPLDQDEDDPLNTGTGSSQTARPSDDEDTDAIQSSEETPLSSPHTGPDQYMSDINDSTAPKELAQPRSTSSRRNHKSNAADKLDLTSAHSTLDSDGDSKVNIEVSAALTRRSRGGFVIESDDDE